MEANRRSALGAAVPPTPASMTLQDASALVTAYIPSEAVGLYVSALAIFAPDTAAIRWAILGGTVALIPLLLVLTGRTVDSGGTKRSLTWKSLITLSIIGTVAFVAWAASLPGTPFLAVTSYANKCGAVAVLLLAAILPRLATLLGVG